MPGDKGEPAGSLVLDTGEEEAVLGGGKDTQTMGAQDWAVVATV